MSFPFSFLNFLCVLAETYLLQALAPVKHQQGKCALWSNAKIIIHPNNYFGSAVL